MSMEHPEKQKNAVKSVVDQVMDGIISQIIDGTLHPGDKLPTEMELCKQFGAGRNSVREAVKKLQAYGITNQSAFYRAIALNGYMLKLDLPEIREMIRLLKNLTNNVNQIARRLNEHGSIYETEIEDIQDRQKEIWETLNGILAKLEGGAG